MVFIVAYILSLFILDLLGVLLTVCQMHLMNKGEVPRLCSSITKAADILEWWQQFWGKQLHQ